MKRLPIAAVVLVVCVVPLASTAAAQREATGPTATRTVVCHRTAARTRPYQRLVVATSAALRRHQAHPADIVPARGACPRTVLTPTQGGTAVTTPLRGVVERPEPGDADGSGTATVRMRRGQGQICFRLVVRDIGAAVAAHIHAGDAKVAGPVLVTLRPPNPGGVSSGCVTVARTRVAQMLATRGRYYVNVHTADFPGGAIRGQLGETAGVRILVADLLGANEVPPADANGRGTAAFRFDSATTEVCFTLATRGIALPAVAAHIHRGAAGANGPVIVALTSPDANGTSRGCVQSTPELVAEILGNPAGFYANVHTPQFPGGAVRGQLS